MNHFFTGLAYTTKHKIGFPHYHRGGLLQLFRKVPFGWEDKGKVKKQYEEYYSYFKCCRVCNSILRVGKEEKKLFRYCSKCLIKTITLCLEE